MLSPHRPSAQQKQLDVQAISVAGDHFGAVPEEILQEELRRLGWGALELGGHSKGHPHKVRIAARLRKETTMTLQWIADRLQMGAPTHVAHLLYWHERNNSNQSSADTLF